MIDKVISAIERHQMLKNGTTVIAALSGGADSMALISILNNIKPKYNLRVIAVHINHGLRGQEADRDEKFVVEYCADHSIELRVLKTDINMLVLCSGEGIEQCGRRIRYDFFESLDTNAQIATAHTLSDSIETIIFNLARGSALKGISGIPAVRGNIIRPMIECTRDEVEEYCSIHQIAYINDSTNKNENYTRNHIRLKIIPQFKKINPRFQDAVLRCSESLTLDEDLLNGISNDLFKSVKLACGYKTDMLLGSHPALRRRALTLILYDLTGTAPQKLHIDMLDRILLNGGTIQVNNGVTVRVRNGIIDVLQKTNEYTPLILELKEGIFEFYEKTIHVKIINRKDLENIQNIHNNILDNCFDYDKINDKAVLRTRFEGDKICIRKRHCTKSLKKLFNESAVPLDERNTIAIIADAKGVIWVEKFGVDQRCEIDEKSERILLIKTGRAQRA